MRLYNYLLNNLGENQVNYLLLLALVSGARFAEIVGLTWNDFDFENNIIDINKTWDYKFHQGFEATKNEESIRTITIEKNTMKAFYDLYTSTKQRDGLIFRSPYSPNKSITNGGSNKALTKILNKLGIERITIHGLRHTHASVLLYKGLTIYYVSERLGHKDIQTTLSYYTHVLDELRFSDDKKALDVFENMKLVEV